MVVITLTTKGYWLVTHTYKDWYYTNGPHKKYNTIVNISIQIYIGPLICRFQVHDVIFNINNEIYQENNL